MATPTPDPRQGAQSILQAPSAQLAAGTKTLAERKGWRRPAVLLRTSSALALGVGLLAWSLFPDQARQQLGALQVQVAKAWLEHPAFQEGQPVPGPNPALSPTIAQQWWQALETFWSTSPARQCVPAAERVSQDPTPRDENGCPLIAPEVASWFPVRHF